jgi:two-component system, NarL family, nitrate/nitrite response regulator NarL
VPRWFRYPAKRGFACARSRAESDSDSAGVARLLAGETDFELVDSCASIDKAVEVLQRAVVDIVLLDFYFDKCDGTDFIRLAREHGFSGKILLVTAGISDGDATELISAGISGIFLKHDSIELLAQVIRYVVAGRVWIEQEDLKRMMEHRAATTVSATEFSEREQAVLSCVFEGFTNRKIAEQMGVSTGSIKATLQQLFSKSGVRTRSQLVRFALEQFKYRFKSNVVSSRLIQERMK